MKKWFIIIFFVILWGGTSDSTVAQTPPPTDDPYDGIDVLFVIDHSGSMGGPEFGSDRLYGPANDPLNLRFLAPQFSTQELSQVRLYLATDPKPDIHVAILAFGDDTEQLMAWTPLVPDVAVGTPMTPADWNDELANLFDILSPQRFGARNLFFTNFNNAFDDARDFFQAMPTSLAPAPGENRLRVVVVVTDGAACTREEIFSEVANGNASYSCNDVLNDGSAQRHMAQLATRARTYFPAPNYEIFVVMLDRNNTYASQVSPWWNDVVCQNNAVACDLALRNAVVRDEIELSAQISRIINQVTGDVVPEGLVTNIDIPCCPPTVPATFTVLPYQQIMRLRVFKNQPQPIPSFVLTNQSLGSSVPTTPQGLDTLIETHQIDNPQPGQYLITAGNYDLIREFSLDSISIASNVSSPTISPASLTALSTFQVETSIIRTDGLPLELYKDSSGNTIYPLTVELRLYDATANIDPKQRPLKAKFPMQLNSTSVHTYLAQYVLDDSFNGAYELRINATFVGDDGITYTLLNDRRLRDNLVIAGAYVQWEGLNPGSQRAQRPVSLRGLVLNEQTGTPVDNTGNMVLRLEVQALDGTIVKPFAEYPNTSASSGIIETSFVIDTAGAYNVNAQLGIPDALGNFVPLGPTFSAPIDIRPPQLVTLALSQPNQPEVEAQRFTLVPLELTTNTPTTIQVEIRDQNGVGVDLGLLTNGLQPLPALTITQNGTPIDLGASLTQVSTGVYAITTDALTLGEYRLEASVNTPNEQLGGDYQWSAPPSASFVLNRVTSPTVYTTIGGGIASLILLAILALFIGRRILERSRNPLKGKITIRIITTMDDGIETETFRRDILLNSPPRHTRIFGRKDGLMTIASLTISTNKNADFSRSGMMEVKECRIDNVPDTQITVPQLISSGDSRDIAMVVYDDGRVDRYVIEKDTNTLDFGSPDSFNWSNPPTQWGGGGPTVGGFNTDIGGNTKIG